MEKTKLEENVNGVKFSNIRKQEPFQVGTKIRNEPLGFVPYQSNPDKHGFTVHIKPSEFHQLASKRNYFPEVNIKAMKDAMKEGKPIAPPFLQAKYENKSDKWKITGHEGRTRSEALQRLGIDEQIPVNIITDGIKRKDITPKMIDSFKKGIVSQDGNKIKVETIKKAYINAKREV